eukprot:3395047-Prymnesium_polylepis.1
MYERYRTVERKDGECGYLVGPPDSSVKGLVCTAVNQLELTQVLGFSVVVRLTSQDDSHQCEHLLTQEMHPSKPCVCAVSRDFRD